MRAESRPVVLLRQPVVGEELTVEKQCKAAAGITGPAMRAHSELMRV
jgi:hypothetical protein